MLYNGVGVENVSAAPLYNLYFFIKRDNGKIDDMNID